MRIIINKIPLWVRPLLGLALVVLGTILALHSTTAIEIFVLLVGLSLLVVGVSRFIEAFSPGSVQKKYWPWVDGGSGILLAVAGVATLLWRGATLPMLALSICLLLLITGAASLASAFGRGSSGRIPAALSGLASILAAGLVLLWPKLSLWVFGVFLGGWLLFAGLRLILDFLSERERSSNGSGGLRGFGRIAGSFLALILAVAMVLVTSFVHAGDPRLVPDAFYTPPTDLPAEP